jgi:hypothetical protein
MNPEVSAVVVTWNAGASLLACIDSLRRSAEAGDVALEIVVVDNASSDASLDTLTPADDIVVVRNPLNAGYGVAATQGLTRATAAWALLVNTDLEVTPTFFREILSAARSAPREVATLVPELRYAADPTIVNSRGVAVDTLGLPLEVDLGASIDSQAGPAVLGGSSGCCLLRLDALRDIGGVEPAFFAYLEDVDLALRLGRAGYEARFVPSAHCVHVGSASVGGDSPLKAYLVARNRRVLLALHGPTTVRSRIARVPVEIGHGLVTTLSGGGLAPWRGRASALHMRRYLRFVRRSRAALEPREAGLPTPPPARILGALRRKRAARRSMHV